MKFALRENRKALGLTQEEIADMLGISVSLYNGLESGKRRMNETYLEGLARIFKIPASQLIIEHRPTVEVAGVVGAGARVPVFEVYEKGAGPRIEVPAGIPTTGIVAVEVVGDSMAPVYSPGEMLLYTRQAAEGVPDEAIGGICVVEDADGMGWVKHLRTGSEPGLFHLVSINPGSETMWDRKVRWAARVRFNLPPELVRKVT